MTAVVVPRYHSLDALRASMMLLGLVLHSAAGYVTTPLGGAWPFRDPHQSVLFDVLVFFIHLFRMPVFFAAAGFFAALLYARDGASGFARNRAMRVLVPLVLFWAAVLPLTGLGLAFAARQVGAPMLWDHTGPEPPLVRQEILGHLWFLYQLLLFYAAAIVVVPLARRVPASLHQRAHAVFRTLVGSPVGALLFGALTTLTMMSMSGAAIDTSASILPPLRILIAYGVFFAFGWLLFANRDLLASFTSRWKLPLAVGLVLGAAYLFIVVGQFGFTDGRVWHRTAISIAGPAIWLLFFGMLGWFGRHLDAPRPIVRYLSDASYWMYITHLVPITFAQGLLAHVDAPSYAKFGIVLGATIVVTLTTYHYIVRPTVVGELLNGRRYPRGNSAMGRISAKKLETSVTCE